MSQTLMHLPALQGMYSNTAQRMLAAKSVTADDSVSSQSMVRMLQAPLGIVKQNGYNTRQETMGLVLTHFPPGPDTQARVHSSDLSPPKTLLFQRGSRHYEKLSIMVPGCVQQNHPLPSISGHNSRYKH